MIFLDSASDVMTGTGHIGSHLLLPAVQFTSDSSLDFADGFATITLSAKGGKASFGDLEFTIPGHTFTDLVFDLQMVKADTTDLTIEAIDGTTLVQSFDLTGLKHDEDLNFILLATGGPLTEISLLSTSGIKEAKHFEVSGIAAIPEPSTWAMLILGFAGLGYASFRKTKSARATCRSPDRFHSALGEAVPWAALAFYAALRRATSAWNSGSSVANAFATLGLARMRSR